MVYSGPAGGSTIQLDILFLPEKMCGIINILKNAAASMTGFFILPVDVIF